MLAGQDQGTAAELWKAPSLFEGDEFSPLPLSVWITFGPDGDGDSVLIAAQRPWISYFSKVRPTSLHLPNNSHLCEECVVNLPRLFSVLCC